MSARPGMPLDFLRIGCIIFFGPPTALPAGESGESFRGEPGTHMRFAGYIERGADYETV